LENRGYANPTQAQIYDYGLYLIDKGLQRAGRSLQEFPPMPLSAQHWEDVEENRYIAEQLAYNAEQQQQMAQERIPKLDEEQRIAFDAVMDSVQQNNPKMMNCSFHVQNSH